MVAVRGVVGRASCSLSLMCEASTVVVNLLAEAEPEKEVGLYLCSLTDIGWHRWGRVALHATAEGKTCPISHSPSCRISC